MASRTRSKAKANEKKGPPTVPTKLLIIADLAGNVPTDPAQYFPKADVLIVCGNIADNIYKRSRRNPNLNWEDPPAAQYKRVFDMVRAIPAEVKIVIPGCFDIFLDAEFVKRTVCLLCPPLPSAPFSPFRYDTESPYFDIPPPT